MLTKSAKCKGRRLSQRVKEKLLSYRPDLPEQDIQVTPSGCTGPDLTFSERAEKEFPFTIECKNQQSISLWQALQQSESHRSGNLTPLLIFSRNHSDDYVALKLDDFLKLVM